MKSFDTHSQAGEANAVIPDIPFYLRAEESGGGAPARLGILFPFPLSSPIPGLAAATRIARPKGVWAKPIIMAGTLWVPPLGCRGYPLGAGEE